MNRWIVGMALLLMVWACKVSAADIPVAWDSILNPQWGVVVYWNEGVTEGPPYTFFADAGINAASYTIENAQPGTAYTISARCYDPISGQYSEAYSNEIRHEVPAFGIADHLLPQLGKQVQEYRLILLLETVAGNSQ